MKKLIRSALNEELSFFMAVPALVWQLLFLYLPIFIIFMISLLKKADVPVSSYFTLEHYTAVFKPIYALILARSLVLALVTSLLCLLVGYPVAYFLATKSRTWKNVLLFLLILPFWTNFLIQVYSWFFVLEKRGLINYILLKVGIIAEPIKMLNNTFAIYLVMVFCYLPFMIMPIYTSLEKINKSLFEASADLGANRWQTLLYVTLPLSFSGIQTGFFLVFVPAFGEFVTPSLLGGAKTLFVGTLISQYFIEMRNIYVGSALTIMSSLAVIVLVFIIYQLSKRYTRYTS